jgi:hypothetical protein
VIRICFSAARAEPAAGQAASPSERCRLAQPDRYPPSAAETSANPGAKDGARSEDRSRRALKAG